MLSTTRSTGLSRQGLDAIEIAPYWAFGQWNVSEAAIDAVLSKITARGLRCSALQGILYNVDNAALFTSEDSRDVLASSSNDGRRARWARGRESMRVWGSAPA